MRDINIFNTEMFPYLEGEEVKGSTLTLTITDIRPEKMKSHAGKDQAKEVLYFKETKKGFVLNKTNSKRVSRMYGRQTGQWEGKKITLCTEEVAAFGEVHDALRVVPGAVSADWMDLETMWGKLNRVQGIEGFYQAIEDVTACREEGTGLPASDDMDGWRTFFKAARDYAMDQVSQALESEGPTQVLEDDLEVQFPEIFEDQSEAE